MAFVLSACAKITFTDSSDNSQYNTEGISLQIQHDFEQLLTQINTQIDSLVAQSDYLRPIPPQKPLNCPSENSLVKQLNDLGIKIDAGKTFFKIEKELSNLPQQLNCFEGFSNLFIAKNIANYNNLDQFEHLRNLSFFKAALPKNIAVLKNLISLNIESASSAEIPGIQNLTELLYLSMAWSLNQNQSIFPFGVGNLKKIDKFFSFFF